MERTPALPRTLEDGRPWWRRPFRVFQTNLRETDAGLDVEATLDAIEAHGSNVWLVNGGGILSFHPTDLEFQSRNPHLSDRASGDLLGDAVAAAHRRGIRVIARMDFSKVTEEVARRHPEWLYVDPAGEHQIYQGLYSTCPAAGYYQEAAFEALTELAERYPVDGFFFNWFGFSEVDYSGRYRGVSQNEASRLRFREWSGGDELPTGPESAGYVRWQQFAAEVIDDLTQRFRAHIADLLPGAAFIRGLGSDVIFHEANNEIGRELWPSATGESISAITTARPGRPVFVNSVAFVDMPYRLAAEESAHYEQYIAQTLARGGNPSVYIMGVPGAIDYPNVDAVAPLFRFHRDNTDAYADLRPGASVVVVQPDALRWSPDAARERRAEFRGVYRALQQRHIAFDVARAADVAADGDALAQYAVVVVPDQGPLDRATATALDDAVDRGATVILTGRSAFEGVALRGTPVESSGEEIGDRDLYAMYAAADADDHGVPRHPVVPVFGTYRPVVARGDAEALLSLVPPAPYGPPEKAHGNRLSSEPAVLTRRAASGGAVTVVPWTVGRSFHSLGLGVCRDLVGDLVERGLPAERLRIDAPAQIEATVMTGDDGIIVHLVNLSGAQGNGFTEPIAAAGVTITVPGTASATELLSRESLKTIVADRSTTIEIPPFGTLAVLRITPSPEGGTSS